MKHLLATSLGLRDESANVRLGQKIAENSDVAAIAALFSILKTEKKDLQHDAIKAIYEAGYRSPALLAPHVGALVEALRSRSNRIVWGAMIGLDCAAAASPKAVEAHLPAVLAAAETGSVITRDGAVGILAKIAAARPIAERSEALALLFDLMKNAPANQFPAYCEKVAPVVLGSLKAQGELAEIIRPRLDEMPTPAKRARCEKVLKKLK